jgi:hypothetical protein
MKVIRILKKIAKIPEKDFLQKMKRRTSSKSHFWKASLKAKKSKGNSPSLVCQYIGLGRRKEKEEEAIWPKKCTEIWMGNGEKNWWIDGRK